MSNSHITIIIVSIIIVPIESISRTVLPYQKKVGGGLFFKQMKAVIHIYTSYKQKSSNKKQAFIVL